MNRGEQQVIAQPSGQTHNMQCEEEADQDKNCDIFWRASEPRITRIERISEWRIPPALARYWFSQAGFVRYACCAFERFDLKADDCAYANYFGDGSAWQREDNLAAPYSGDISGQDRSGDE